MREIFSPSCSIDNHADIPSSPRDRYIHTPGYKKGKKNTGTHAQIQTLIKRLIWILQQRERCYLIIKVNIMRDTI